MSHPFEMKLFDHHARQRSFLKLESVDSNPEYFTALPGGWGPSVSIAAGLVLNFSIECGAAFGFAER
jgi:hypothetical protein